MAPTPRHGYCSWPVKQLRARAEITRRLLVVCHTLVRVTFSQRAILPLRTECEIADGTAEEGVEHVALFRINWSHHCACYARVTNYLRVCQAWSGAAEIIVQVEALREVELRAGCWDALCNILFKYCVREDAILVPYQRSGLHSEEKQHRLLHDALRLEDLARYHGRQAYKNPHLYKQISG